MLRTSFLKKYVNVDLDKIEHIVSHHFSMFIPLFFRNVLFLVVLLALYWLLNKYTVWDNLTMLFGFFGLIILGKFIIDFLNIYLDSLVLTEEGLILFLWEGVLENKVEVFSWDRIETISYSQKGLSDKLLISGDVDIILDDGIQFPFEKVSSPKKHMDKILRIKDKHFKHKNNDEKFEDERMTILVDALSDIVKDYTGKDKKDQYEDDGF